MKNETALSVHQVSKTFTTRGGTVHAVQNVSFSIGTGEIVALLGENGAGKSTLIDIILGMVPPDQGKIQLYGERPADAIRKGRVGAILQTGGLLQELSVLDQIQMVAATYSHPFDIKAVMEQAGVLEFAEQKIEKCSGGQQQKIKFALALIASPDLLILDEPTAGMDVNARAEFWKAMQDLTTRGTTIIFATHYLEEAEHFSQRIVMMARGKVLANQSVAHLRNAQNKSNFHFSLDSSELDKFSTFPWTSAIPLNVQRNGTQFSLTSDNPENFAQELLNNFAVSQLEVQKPHLEEIFKTLTHSA